jgi:recombination protein RecA
MSPSKIAFAAFEKRFKKSFGDSSLALPVEREIIPSGSLELDYALGVGGFPVGRVYESWGPESVGKTTMGLIMAAQQQREFPDKHIAWIDMERSFDTDWAVAHGIDLGRCYVIQPLNAEEVADQLKLLLESDVISSITVDSVGGMISKVEFDKDAEEAVVGTIAKIVTRMVKIAAVRAAEHGATVHIINQVRANIGSYGADTTTGGGFALKHATTFQLHFKKTGETPLVIGSGETRQIVGKTIAVQVSKNKVAPPNRTAMITLLNQPTDEYGPVGIDQAGEAFRLGKRTGQFTQAGAYYSLPDESRHQGEVEVTKYLREHSDLIERIRVTALGRVAHTVVPTAVEEG